MNFHYKRIGRHYRPIIAIEVQYKNKTIRQEVLIDSGADLCIFRGEIGELLGLKVKKGELVEFGGIAGEPKVGYLHSIGLTVGSVTHKVRAMFSYDVSDYGYGTVGQAGFFENFAIKFDYRKRSIVLRAK